ncbi:MAG: hypothetical protein R8K22_02620 [Mariprofundaceae bacterium]
MYNHSEIDFGQIIKFMSQASPYLPTLELPYLFDDDEEIPSDEWTNIERP